MPIANADVFQPLVDALKERVAFQEEMLVRTRQEIANLKRVVEAKDDLIRIQADLIAVFRGVIPRTTQESRDRSRSPLRFGDSD